MILYMNRLRKKGCEAYLYNIICSNMPHKVIETSYLRDIVLQSATSIERIEQR